MASLLIGELSKQTGETIISRCSYVVKAVTFVSKTYFMTAHSKSTWPPKMGNCEKVWRKQLISSLCLLFQKLSK